jgi:hypothetical protein
MRIARALRAAGGRGVSARAGQRKRAHAAAVLAAALGSAALGGCAECCYDDGYMASRAASPGHVRRSASRIPLPDRALLAPQAEPNCEFKTAAVGSTEEVLRTKLDYERQCYRQSEQIVRDRLRQLQEQVGKTVKAVDGSEAASR